MICLWWLSGQKYSVFISDEFTLKGRIVEKEGLTIFVYPKRLWVAVIPVALDCGCQHTDIVMHILC